MAQLSESLTQAFERLRHLELMVGSWEERLRLCEAHKGILHHVPNSQVRVVSSTKCSVKSCYEESQENKKFCSKHISKACTYPDCNKTRLGPLFCIRHGGGKRCEFEGCLKVSNACIFTPPFRELVVLLVAVPDFAYNMAEVGDVKLKTANQQLKRMASAVATAAGTSA